MKETNVLRADAVFEGGGVKGIGLVGAVAVAEERGYEWQNVAGTSAGAIVAALLAAGYTAAEMKEIMDKLDYNNFTDTGLLDRVPLVGKIASVIFEKGIYEGRWFENWMRGLLQEKGIKTFGDLIHPEFKDDIRYRFKLRVIASDVSGGRMLVLPQDVEGFGVRPEDLKSMSIPFFYEPVRLRNMKTNQLSYIVDGGILSNFPVWLFDTEGSEPPWPTFGFKLVEPGEGLPHKIRGPISMLTALFSTMSEAHDARYIKDADFVRTIGIPTLDVGTTEFDLSPQKSEALYQSGRKAAEEFFTTWNFTEYVDKYRISKPRPGRGLRLRSGFQHSR